MMLGKRPSQASLAPSALAHLSVWWCKWYAPCTTCTTTQTGLSTTGAKRQAVRNMVLLYGSRSLLITLNNVEQIRIRYLFLLIRQGYKTLIDRLEFICTQLMP